MKKMKKNNKGFSLVELIIVIAIMAVLVGVLAPQFIKYVEQSRRGTDIQNAEQIKTAILADIADGVIRGTTGSNQYVFISYTTAPGANSVCATTIAQAPTVQGNIGSAHGSSFLVTYDAGTGACSVIVNDGANNYVLTDPTGAQNYKNQ